MPNGNNWKDYQWNGSKWNDNKRGKKDDGNGGGDKKGEWKWTWQDPSIFCHKCGTKLHETNTRCGTCQTRFRSVCKFYVRKNGCKNGSKCKYSHDLPSNISQERLMCLLINDYFSKLSQNNLLSQMLSGTPSF